MSEEKARELIMLAIGSASMCWENLQWDNIGKGKAGAGTFLSDRAIEVGDQLLVDLGLKAAV